MSESRDRKNRRRERDERDRIGERLDEADRMSSAEDDYDFGFRGEEGRRGYHPRID